MKIPANLQSGEMLKLLLLLNLCSFPCSRGEGEERHEKLSNNPASQASSLGEVETHFVFMDKRKTANLECAEVAFKSQNETLEQVHVQWYKLPGGSNSSSKEKSDMSQYCISDKDDDDEDDKKEKDKKKCEVVLKLGKHEDYFESDLKLRNLKKDDYGEYECSYDGKILRKFSLRGDIRVLRRTKDDDKDIERSVIITEGQILYLYCTYSGLEPEKDINDIKFFKLSWYKDGMDITQKLKNLEGDFQNFTESSPNEFQGLVQHSHRGEYTCQVNLTESYENNASLKFHKTFPVQYKFTVRVRDEHKWMIPGGILLVEILSICIFTACIWKWEERKELGDDDAAPQDSDDEGDETPKTK